MGMGSIDSFAILFQCGVRRGKIRTLGVFPTYPARLRKTRIRPISDGAGRWPFTNCFRIVRLGRCPISANFKISHGIISIIRFRALARHRRLSFKSSLIRSHSAITSLILKAGSMAACNRCSMKANSRQRLRSGLQLAAPGGKIPRLAGQLFCQQADKQFPVKPRSCAAVVSLGKVAGIR